MEFLANIDREVFLLVNQGFTSGALDSVMTYVTEKFNFLGAIIVAAVLILVLGKRKDRVGLLLLVVLVLLSDLAANLLKHALMRVRPCNAIDGVRLLVGCGGSYSLPSGHATNIFAAMVFLTLRYRKFAPAFLAMAFAVSYSRVYVGVHYPFDVAFGAVLGSLIAYGFSIGEKRFLAGRFKTLAPPRDEEKERGPFEA